jgi:hypothetical protein
VSRRDVSRREVAVRLDVPLEMLVRHDLPARMSEADFVELDSNPPAWLQQSRANRTAKPVWVDLRCDVCGYTEKARPKKWWPAFTYLSCDFHSPDELPEPAAGLYRRELEGIGSRFVAIVDERP